MTTRIAYNSENGTGREIAEFVNSVQQALAKGRRLKAKLDSMSFGNDWQQIELEIGGMAAAVEPQPSGQTLWVIVATAIQQIDAPQVAELSRLDKA